MECRHLIFDRRKNHALSGVHITPITFCLVEIDDRGRCQDTASDVVGSIQRVGPFLPFPVVGEAG